MSTLVHRWWHPWKFLKIIICMYANIPHLNNSNELPNQCYIATLWPIWPVLDSSSSNAPNTTILHSSKADERSVCEEIKKPYLAQENIHKTGVMSMLIIILQGCEVSSIEIYIQINTYYLHRMLHTFWSEPQNLGCREGGKYVPWSESPDFSITVFWNFWISGVNCWWACHAKKHTGY